MGVTRACFNPDGTVPVDKETLTILVTWGARSCRHCLVRVVGMGSRVSEDTTKYHLNLLLNISIVQLVVCTPTTDLNQTLQLLALYNYNNDQG